MSHEGLQFIDTHCHIHDAAFSDKFQGKAAQVMIAEAKDLGVQKFICVGTDLLSSEQALKFSIEHKGCFASIALHPHEAEHMDESQIDDALIKLGKIARNNPARLVAIGECGLDYFYHSDTEVRQRQAYMLMKHLDLAVALDKPLIFHIRDAFPDFFKILDSFASGRTWSKKFGGVVHSFSATEEELAGVLQRGLYVGLNGIMTFTKDERQLAAARAVPIERLLIETDAPFLTPVPFRGKMCEPKHVVRTLEFLSELRGESLEEFAKVTTANAQRLFDI